MPHSWTSNRLGLISSIVPRLYPFLLRAVDAVNLFVAEKTYGLIPRVISSLPTDGILLINTIYFKAQFYYKFDPDSTRSSHFTLFNHQEMPITLMHQDGYILYYDTGSAQVCLLPFDG